MKSFTAVILLILAGIFCCAPSHAEEVPLLIDSSGNRISLLKSTSIMDIGNDLISVTLKIGLTAAAADTVREQLMLTAGDSTEFARANRVSHVVLRMAFRISAPMARIMKTVFLACDDKEIRTSSDSAAHAGWEYVRGDLLKIALKIKRTLGIRQPFTYTNDYLRDHKAAVTDHVITYYTFLSDGERFCSTPGFKVISKPGFLSASQFLHLLAVKDATLLASCSKGDVNSCSIYEKRYHTLKTVDAPTRCLFRTPEHHSSQEPERQREFRERGGSPMAGLYGWIEGKTRQLTLTGQPVNAVSEISSHDHWMNSRICQSEGGDPPIKPLPVGQISLLLLLL